MRVSLRLFWFALGWVCVALGFIGAVLPVMPSTVFFIAAAACFARSSPRFEAWVLNLPGVGPLVRDYRAGTGMPRRVRSLFGGFGYSRADMNFTLRRRLMALLLLHRASDPVRHICIEGWQQRTGDLFALQELLWRV